MEIIITVFLWAVSILLGIMLLICFTGMLLSLFGALRETFRILKFIIMINRPEPINEKKANRTFLICLIIAFILACTIANAQIHKQNEDRFSIQLITDNVVFQKHIFYGGVEFKAEFSNGIYIRPQIHYAALKDGYLETSAGLGYNLAYNRWNYNTGIKLGVINRTSTYPLFALEAGFEYHLTDNIAIGIRGSYDSRGDSDFYDGQKWVYNSQGIITFKL